MPGEEKAFTQYFMPYKGVGIVKNATVDAAVGLEIENGEVTVRAYTTSPQSNAKAILQSREAVVWEQTFAGGPGSFFAATIPLPNDIPHAGLAVKILSGDGQPLVDWTVPAEVEREIPEPAKAIERPEKTDSVESLYLAGLHLEQYRHATREPADYYREALRRDPGDARSNMALGKLLYRRGRFAEAEPYLRRAIERLTRHNPNPYDGEPYSLLGCTLERLAGVQLGTCKTHTHASTPADGYEAAYAAYHKAVWNAAWQDAGYFALARLDLLLRGWLDRALENANACLNRNAAHWQARHLKVVLLRLLDRAEEATSLAQDSLQRDVFQRHLARVDDARQGQPESDCRSIVLRPNARRPTQLS